MKIFLFFAKEPKNRKKTQKTSFFYLTSVISFFKLRSVLSFFFLTTSFYFLSSNVVNNYLGIYNI